jgi:hypothetical protein
MADAKATKYEESRYKTTVFAQNRGLDAFELFAGISGRQSQEPLRNKTATSRSEKQNAVLTLRRDANYNSCRTQNSSRTEFGVVGCGGFVLVQEQSMTHFEEATG